MCSFADEEGGVVHEIDNNGDITVKRGKVRIELPASVRLKVALKQALVAKNKELGEKDNG